MMSIRVINKESLMNYLEDNLLQYYNVFTEFISIMGLFLFATDCFVCKLLNFELNAKTQKSFSVFSFVHTMTT